MSSKLLLFFFVIPAFFDVFNKSSQGQYDYDLVLVMVAIVTAVVGSTVQISHKNLEKAILKREVFAIYTTSMMVAIISYFLGVWTEKLVVTALVSSVASYMSLELFETIKKAILTITNGLPSLWEGYWRSKYKIKDDDRDNN